MNLSIFSELYYRYLIGAFLITLNFSEITLASFSQQNISIFIIFFFTINSFIIVYLFQKERDYQNKDKDRVNLQAIRNIVATIHNQPLQTISYLLKSVQQKPQISNKELIEQLHSLDREIHYIEESLQEISITDRDNLESNLGIDFDPHYSLHEVLYEVYSKVLQQNLSGFAKLKVKIRSFEPVEVESLTVKQKQQFGRILACALFDLGNNYRDITRLQAIGKPTVEGYSLTIKTNSNVNPNLKTKESKVYCQLIKKLGGKLQRQSSKSGSSIYEINLFFS